MLSLPELSHAQTRTVRIAFNAPDMASTPFAYALALVQKEAEPMGVTIFPQDGKGSAVQQSGDLMNSVNMGLDGIILAPDDEGTLSPAVNDVLAANVPIVTIACRLRGIDRPLLQLSDEENHQGLTEQTKAALKAIVNYVRDQKPLQAAEVRGAGGGRKAGN
jgi:ABC-type sugar transport system substrate-binding protein